MQEIWEYGLGWDEKLPTELKNKWETWCSQVCLLNDLTLERKYFPYPLDKGKDLQLHIFCDASPRAFGAVAFNKRSDDLSTEEIDGAEKFWIQLVQRDAFAEEVNCLRARKLLLKTSVILEFNPFLDSDELIRVGERLQKSKFSYLQKHPIILPAKHYFVNLMVRDSRKGVQVTAPLPALRVEHSAAFSVVGIDFGGPLHTKDENKHYIVLFTCAVTRALHLELVKNLTTETFLLALRRFISRRGLCSKILTDNAKTFKKSELELKNLWKIISDPTVKAFYASHKIYWQFIMERATWWGGFYETYSNSKACFTKDCGKSNFISR
ncbi:integrase catalytic domain-containing protein [Trichonephila clavipes]|nr:integrase catalytic domain-containing protein [Trichonephila clavipes]